MRNGVAGTVTVKAISGTHVVFLATDMVSADAREPMGFAIQREDKTERETTCLRGDELFLWAPTLGREFAARGTKCRSLNTRRPPEVQRTC